MLNVTPMTFRTQHCVIIFLAFKIFKKKKKIIIIRGMCSNWDIVQPLPS